MSKTLDAISLDNVYLKDMQDDSVLTSPIVKYLYIVQKIANAVTEDGRNSVLFFRGQANDSWNVAPSVFREGQLSNEHRLIEEALGLKPGDFANQTKFERFAKLQHYEMSTRLLDVTENPLIALYFACKDANEEDKDGSVYITPAYPIYSNSHEVQILSSIAHLDISRITLRDLWLSLAKEGIALPAPSDEPDIMKLLDNYIDLIARNYFVRANFDNERIKQQSGAFLLAGCIETSAHNDKWATTSVKKSTCLKPEFTHKIVIPADIKKELLNMLDMVNVNEAAVFPELTYQMRHIKDKFKKVATMPTSFDNAEISSNDVSSVQEPTIAHDNEVIRIVPIPLKHEPLLPDNLGEIIHMHIDSFDLAEAVRDIFIENAKLDWHLRAQLQTRISRAIRRFLHSTGSFHNQEQCLEAAVDIVEAVAMEARKHT